MSDEVKRLRKLLQDKTFPKNQDSTPVSDEAAQSDSDIEFSEFQVREKGKSIREHDETFASLLRDLSRERRIKQRSLRECSKLVRKLTKDLLQRKTST